jgi:hypothetical protein
MMRVLFALAVAPAVASLFRSEQDGLALFLAGLALGILLAGMLLPFYPVTTESFRMGVGLIVTVVGTCAGAFLANVAGLIPYVAGLVPVAVIFFLLEQSLSLRISTDGIEQARWLPWSGSRVIPWETVQTIRADLRTITIHGALFSSTEHQNLLVITGNGTRIRFNTARWSNGNNYVQVVLDHSREAARRWTLTQVRELGRADLGSLRLYRDRLAWSRVTAFVTSLSSEHEVVHVLIAVVVGILLIPCGIWLLIEWMRGFDEVAMEKIKGVRLDRGSLWIELPAGVRRLSGRAVRNALYLPEIVQTLKEDART